MNGSIRKRGKNTWELTVEVGRDAGGKRLRKFTNVKGTKAQAEKKLRELLTSLDKGMPVSTDKISVGQWLSKWMAEYIIHNKREITIEHMKV